MNPKQTNKQTVKKSTLKLPSASTPYRTVQTKTNTKSMSSGTLPLASYHRAQSLGSGNLNLHFDEIEILQTLPMID